jgi:membrane protein HdeD
MNPFFAFYDRSYGYSRAIITLVAGLLLVSWPDAIAKTIVIILGSFIAAVGIVSLVLSFLGKWKKEEASLISMNAIVDIVLGIVIIIFNQFFASIIMYLFGILLLIFGLSEIISLLQTLRTAKVNWSLFIGPAITTICGIIVFFNPFKTLQWLFVFFGISLLIYSISEFIATYKVRKALKDLKPEKNPIIEDTTAEEVK